MMKMVKFAMLQNKAICAQPTVGLQKWSGNKLFRNEFVNWAITNIIVTNFLRGVLIKAPYKLTTMMKLVITLLLNANPLRIG